MKTNAKRRVSLLLAMVMALAMMAVPVSAVEEDESIIPSCPNCWSSLVPLYGYPIFVSEYTDYTCTATNALGKKCSGHAVTLYDILGYCVCYCGFEGLLDARSYYVISPCVF